MALQKCHECGRDVSSEAKSCPACGAMVKPQNFAPKQAKKPGGCVLVIGAILLLSFLITIPQTCQQNVDIKKGQELSAEYQKKLIQDEESSKKFFIDEIEYYYKLLLRYYKNKQFDNAITILDRFNKYGKMDYKDVSTIEKKVIAQKDNKKAKAVTSHEESCYQLGYRYGRCGTMALKGYQCDPQDDIIVPVRCRGLSETDRGTYDGVKSVW